MSTKSAVREISMICDPIVRTISINLPFSWGIRIHVMMLNIIVLFNVLYKGSNKKAEYCTACSDYKQHSAA